MPRRRMTTTALLVIGFLAVVYAGILLALWQFQERIVFQPPAKPDGTEDTRRLQYTSRDGIRLFAYVVEPARPGGPVVLAFHGNAMISRWMIPWARDLSRRFDATVVLPEYRGYDGLDGVPNYAGAAMDAQAALEATQAEFGIAASRMVFYGHSLGTAVATELATKAAPRSLVLESPFSSARDMAARFPIFGLGFFWPAISRVHYRTIEHVRTIASPVYVVHGERDIIIPVQMGKEVHGAALTPGRFLLVAEAGHNDVAIAGGDSYWRWLGEALNAGSR